MEIMEDMELVRLASELIKIRSYSGEEEEIARFIRDYMLENGFDSAEFDKYGSVIGCINGKRPGKSILLDGHIDTVRADDADLWKHSPFGAEIADGKLFGRGASDMKGSVACMIRAALAFAKSCNRDFSGKVFVSCSVHEECFEGVASVSIAERTKPDFVIIGEATSGTIKIGQRGRAEVVVETQGVSCHSSNPEKGVNAVYHFCRLVDFIRNIKPNSHKILGNGILELTDIISKPFPGSSVVPSKCIATFDRRTLVGEDESTVIGQIEEAIGKCKAVVPELKARAYLCEASADCWTEKEISSKRFFPAWVQDEKSEIVVKASNGLRKAGIDFSLSHFDFCTNGSGFAGVLGLPCIGYGPSLESLAHVRDEYVELDELHKAFVGFAAIIGELLH